MRHQIHFDGRHYWDRTPVHGWHDRRDGPRSVLPDGHESYRLGDESSPSPLTEGVGVIIVIDPEGGIWKHTPETTSAID